MLHGQFTEIQFGKALHRPLSFIHNGNVKWLAFQVLSLECVAKKSPAAYILSDCMQLPTSAQLCITMQFLRARTQPTGAETSLLGVNFSFD